MSRICCGSGNTNGEDILYNVPIEKWSLSIGETPILRHPDMREAIGPLEYYDNTLKTLGDIHMRNVKETPFEEFLGFRKRIMNTGLIEEKFSWWTYQEAFDKACILAHRMEKNAVAKPKKEFKDYSLKFVAIYSKNTKEYIIFDSL